MRTWSFLSLLFISSILFSNCGYGTLRNFRESDELNPYMGGPYCCYQDVYGGVREDSILLYVSVYEAPSFSLMTAGLLPAFLIADLPASFALDTITLPVTITHQVHEAELYRHWNELKEGGKYRVREEEFMVPLYAEPGAKELKKKVEISIYKFLFVTRRREMNGQIWYRIATVYTQHPENPLTEGWIKARSLKGKTIRERKEIHEMEQKKIFGKGSIE